MRFPHPLAGAGFFQAVECGCKETTLKDINNTCCTGLCALGVALTFLIWGTLVFAASSDSKPAGYEAARWNPIHFKPAIDKAEDKECLACHAEVLAPSMRKQSPAGVRADRSLAWYQTLDTYSGDQDTFHRRHLTSDFAKRVMNMRCNTCHQGHDPRPRAQAPGSSASSQPGGYDTRKTVEARTCLMCHGKFDGEVMGLGSWEQHRESMDNNCLLCHDTIRTTRHNVNFLKPKEIEVAGKESGDSCYGCHGGRSWYRIGFPFPRHAWPGMDKEVPEWAKNRPTQSDPRFLRDMNKPQAAVKPGTFQPKRASKPRSDTTKSALNVKGESHVQ